MPEKRKGRTWSAELTVVGLGFRWKNDVIAMMPGWVPFPVAFEREPDNRADENAIKVLIAGDMKLTKLRGVDIVTIRQGAPAAEPDLSDAGPGRDIDLGTLGAGRVLLRSTGPTLIAHPGGEAFVHVAGTLSPGELQAIAAGLRRS